MKRILAMLLALLMLVTCFLVSCGDDETESQPGKQDESQGTGPSETETETETEETLQHAEGWAKGKSMTLAGYTSYIDYTKDWVVTSTSEGDVMELAVWQRNQNIQNYMGSPLNVQVMWYAWADMDTYNNTLINSIKSNNQKWDVVASCSLMPSFLTTNAVCRNLYKINSIDMTHSWYNQDLANSVAYNNQLFSVASYGAITTVKSILCLFINEDRISELKLTMPYDLVEEGTWTFDKVREYQIAGSEDVGNDGVWQLNNDRLGIKFVHRKFMPAWFFAAGETFTYMDNNGRIQLSDLLSSKVVNVRNATREMVTYYGGGADIGDGTGGSAVVFDDYTGARGYQSFCDGYDMMYFTDGRNINRLRGINGFTWGAVPLPKWDTDQDEYHSLNDEELATFWIPNDVDKEKAGMLLETFSYFGYKYTYPAYVEDVLYTKGATTEQAAYMYDIMLQSLTYDFAFYYNIAMYGAGSFGSFSIFWAFRNNSYNNTSKDWTTYWSGHKATFEEGLKDLLDRQLVGLPD